MSPALAREAPKTSRLWTYRVRGIPLGLDWDDATSLIGSTLKIRDWELRSLAPDPVRNREQTATFEVLQPPYGMLQPCSDSEWQFPIPSSSSGSTDASTENILEGSRSTRNLLATDTSSPSYDLVNQKFRRQLKKMTITVDKHFRGLTPLNRPEESVNYIEYAIPYRS